jgi:hypothetical protein
MEALWALVGGRADPSKAGRDNRTMARFPLWRRTGEGSHGPRRLMADPMPRGRAPTQKVAHCAKRAHGCTRPHPGRTIQSPV